MYVGKVVVVVDNNDSGFILTFYYNVVGHLFVLSTQSVLVIPVIVNLRVSIKVLLSCIWVHLLTIKAKSYDKFV